VRIYGSDGLELLTRTLVDPVDTSAKLSIVRLGPSTYGIATKDDSQRQLLEGILLTLRELVDLSRADQTLDPGNPENTEGVA
jgi:hypothetical protein